MNTIKLIVLCLMTLKSLTAFAFPYDEKNQMKFGKVSDEEIRMVSSTIDTGAAAVVIADVGSSSLVFNQAQGYFEMMFERHCRIKILKNTGYDEANIEIPLYKSGSSKQAVVRLKAFTYNLEGEKIVQDKLPKSSIFQESFNEHWDIYKFTLPNVKEGSVFEFSYRILSDFYQIRTWEFQKDIPVMWSEYKVRIPEYFNYLQSGQGYEPFYITESTRESRSLTFGGKSTLMYSENVHYWAAKDMPGLANEKYITTPGDFATKVEFQLATYQPPHDMVHKVLSDWPEVEKTLLEDSDFGVQLKRGNFMKDDIAAAISECEDNICKIGTVYDMIKNRMQWNEKNALFCKQNLKKIYDEKVGNAADINILLVAALRETGIQADPVILSTRSNGRIHPVYPLVEKFNYVIAHAVVDGASLLLDATDKFLVPGQLPVRCLNFKGRLISESNARWIDLGDQGESVSMFFGQVNLAEDGALAGRVSLSSTGYDALTERKALATDENEYLKAFKEEKSSWEILDHEFENVHELSDKLVRSFEVRIPDAAYQAGNMIFINPMLTEGFKENLFKQPERKYPVDLTYPRKSVFHLTINLPDDYELEETPEPAIFALPENSGTFSYNVSQMGRSVQISSSYAIKKAFFMPNEYASLREFHELIVAKHAEQITLKKK